MDRTLAARLFADNFERFRNNTEKSQLYGGLANMADMVEAILSKLDGLEQEIEALRRAR
ncbi:MAG: hypothetical protein ACLPYB_04635 [Desulfobaccales bacterium]